ncbi:MAG: hypothetical protein GY835_23595 [bacterium]|nr:hypothetical protein [bacterium]
MRRSNRRLFLACCVLALSLVAGLSMVAQPAEALGPCFICAQAEGPCLGFYPKGWLGCTVVYDEVGFPNCLLLHGPCLI